MPHGRSSAKLVGMVEVPEGSMGADATREETGFVLLRFMS